MTAADSKPALSKRGTSSNRDMIDRTLAAVWHPCTQMKVHETFPPLPVLRLRKKLIDLSMMLL